MNLLHQNLPLKSAGRDSASIDLTVDTIDESDGLVWADAFRQGIHVKASEPFHLLEGWLKGRLIEFDLLRRSVPKISGILLQYIKTTDGFILARTLVQFADSVIQAKLPQPAQSQPTR